MTANLLSLAAPIISKVAPAIAEGVKNKVFPGGIQQAINAGMKEAAAEDEKLPYEQHLFYTSERDGIKGYISFLGKYFGIAGVQNELAKAFDNEGKPDVDYLVAEFNKTAAGYNVVNPTKSRVKPWLTTFVEGYFKSCSTALKFQVAKANYFQQLNERYDNIKFSGIAVPGEEESKKNRMQQIFVMPDVVPREQKQMLLPDFMDELPTQQRLIREQRQLARLSNTNSSPLLANKLLTETRQKKAVILGAPGSGKSTLVSYFAIALAQEKAADLGLDSNTDWLPIVIEIRDFERNLNLNILEYLRQFAEDNLTTKKLPPDFFQHWLDRGKAVILFDGIDEVADAAKRNRVVEKINSFLHQYRQNIAIITSRPSGYRQDYFSTGEFPHYQLQPFDDDKIEEFINHWYDSRYSDPKEAARCKDSLRKALADNDRIKLLAKNPLLITIIALIHRYQAYLPKERYKLYDKAVETLLISWDTKKVISGHKVLQYLDLYDLRRLLEKLAHWIHSQGSTGDTEGGTQIDKDDLLEWLSKYIKISKQKELYQAREEAKRFLAFIRERTGLLNEQGTNRYAFVHKTFQEYFCAQDINYEADDNDFTIVLDCIKEHLHVSHWREVLLLLVAQQKPQKAIKAIKTIYENKSEYEQWLHRDLLFAGACLADSPRGMKAKDKDGLADKILQALVNLEIADENKTGDRVKQQVFKVITSLVETEWETEALNLLKKQKNKIEQCRFINYQAALNKPEQAIKVLLTLLEDDNYDVRYFATSALGQIGKDNSKVIAALLALLEDDDSDIRYQAASTLGKIDKDNPKAITALLTLLEDDFSMRCLAALTLGEIGKDNPKAIAALLALLEDDDSDIRYLAALTLGEIGKDNSEVIAALFELLENDDTDMRYKAASTLGKIGKDNSKVIAALVALLEDNNSMVRCLAALTLREIGKDSSEVIATLLALLKDNNSGVRYLAALTLREIGKDNSEVIATLLALLKDNNSGVRYTAALALSQIDKDNSEAIATLLALLKDNNSGVRYTVALALSQISKDNLEVITALLALLEDDNSDIRYKTTKALAKIGKHNPKIISSIANWLEQHHDTQYVGNGINVLWNLVIDDD